MSTAALLEDEVGHDLSLEQRVALLTPQQQEHLLAELDPEMLAWDWAWSARPSQYLDVEDDSWSVTLLLGGRGAGKTRSVTEWARDLDQNWDRLHRDPGERMRGALLARTAGDVRDTLLQGPSGLLHIWPPSLVDGVVWTPSRRELVLPGGSTWTTFSGEAPDQLRGPAQHVAVVDELAAHNGKPGVDGLTAWDNVRIGTRMGRHPQVVASTTPKRTAVMRALLAEARTKPTVHLRQMRTLDNAWLAQVYLDTVVELFGGTTIGRQELDGVMLDDVEGALLTQEVFDTTRVNRLPPGGPRGAGWIRIVAVDPSVAERPQDECGIVVLATPGGLPVINRQCYVLEDLSARMNPSRWGRAVAEAAYRWDADVVAEVNQGGALVRRVIAEEAARLGRPAPRVREVHSKVGKALRAEPIVAAYERGRIHHLHTFPELEDQWCSWVPGQSGYSPDRLDACLVAGTLIATARGDVPIEQVCPGDLVHTRAGLREVTWAGMTGSAQPVRRLVTSDGRVLRGTGDHLIWSGDDFVPLDSLVYGDKLETWTSPQSRSSGVTRSGDVSSTAQTGPSGSTSCQPDAGSTFTLRSGKSITASPFLPIITFIMLTATRSTTLRRTLSRSPLLRTTGHMRPLAMTTPLTTASIPTGWSTLLRSVCWPLRGTPVLRVLRGTPSTARRPGRPESDCLPESASSVGHSSSRTWREQGGAPKHVEHGGTEPSTPMTNEPSVRSAAPSSGRSRASTQQQPVPVCVERNYADGTADVYDLTVEGEHEFFANGVLVHNCVHGVTALILPSSVKGGLGTGVSVHSATGYQISTPPSAATRGEPGQVVPVGVGRRNGWGVAPPARSFRPGRARGPRLPSHQSF